MSNAVTIIKKGEDLPFSFDLAGAAITGWTCVIEVMKFPGNTAQISRTITPTGKVWEGFLTATETAALTPIGMYRIIGKLVNTTTDEAKADPVRFNLTDAW